MKITNVVRYIELVQHAGYLNYTWEQTHKYLRDIFPKDGTLDIYPEIVEHLNPDCQIIIREYMNYHNLKEFMIIE